MEFTFKKMHGLGNDFVILDQRTEKLPLSKKQIRMLANRRIGIGCDQLIILDVATKHKADIRMQIFNADGGEVAACGNATRCVGYLLMRELGKANVSIETSAGLLSAYQTDKDDWVRVDMGEPKLEWYDIPLSKEKNTADIDLGYNALGSASVVNVGNPHCVFFVNDLEEMNISSLGKEIERHPLFPERINVEFVEILDRSNIRMRVWERGAGITQACGTGACASVVAAISRELLDRVSTVEMDGGILKIEWNSSDNHVYMTGSIAEVFEGKFLQEL